jgi:hypothetical protein
MIIMKMSEEDSINVIWADAQTGETWRSTSNVKVKDGVPATISNMVPNVIIDPADASSLKSCVVYP